MRILRQYRLHLCMMGTMPTPIISRCFLRFLLLIEGEYKHERSSTSKFQPQ